MKSKSLVALICCSVICVLLSCSQKERSVQPLNTPARDHASDHVDSVQNQNDQINPVADKTRIKEIILKHLGIDHEEENSSETFGFYIIQVDSDEVVYFSKLYKDHVPHVEVCVRGTDCSSALIDDDYLDRKTKRHCKVLSARITNIDRTRAKVEAVAISGKLGGAFYSYSVTNQNNAWKIVERKLTGAI